MAQARTQVARAAEWYAKNREWTVFPLRPRTKEPFANLGVYSATSDLSQIREWWQRWPQANIGLHCGGCNLLALDMDTYKDVFEGDEMLGVNDEETLTNLTGSGGTHLLYRVENGERYGNQKGSLPAGIDVRGWGGYVVLPPSIHPNGRLYAWETGYGPHEIDAMYLPEALANILEAAQVTRRHVGPADEYAIRISEQFVESIIAVLSLAHYGKDTYDGVGRKWILKKCPFNPHDDPHPDDKAAYIVVARDGHIGAGCHHARCQELLNNDRLSGWKYLLREREYVCV